MSFFSPFPALKLATIATAMLANFALGKKKIKFLKFTNFHSLGVYIIIFFLFTSILSAQNEDFKFKKTSFENTTISTSKRQLHLSRLDKINKIKNSIVMKHVKKYINFNSLPKTKGRAEFYFYFFEEKLKKYNLPEKLKYLAIVESNLNAKAISSSGAKGLWQFMPKTGAQYGLYENNTVSLFFDPIASTDAACRYLRDLYEKFKDWDLVLAAYNCGPGRVSKIMRKTGGKTFWSIRSHLPKETQNYVPSFLAVKYVFDFYKIRNIKPRALKLKSNQIKTIITTQKTNKSSFYGTKREQLIFNFLNPQLLTTSIPISTKIYLNNSPK